MNSTVMRITFLSLVLVSFAGAAIGHGLIEDPPSRNWFCGAITKPDEVLNGVAEFPVCGEAFADDFNGGYQFMSVLTHDRGRTEVSPLPESVCGFGSETFNGGATPWDTAIDWPTSPMSAGRQEFKWNIQWGPHFDDTEEFRYWITRPDFQFEVGQPLTWDDFEPTEFCTAEYDDASPNANPDVISLKETTQFRTFCEVPARSGRHVIYGEWGRNFFTFERFHGCIDVVFDGTAPPPGDTVAAVVSLQPDPDVDRTIGESSIRLDGSASLGEGLTYIWSVNAPDTSLYSIADPSQAVTTLQLAAPAASQSVTISLMVSNADDSASANRTFLHESEAVSFWLDLGQLTTTPEVLTPGDQISVRAVLDNGQDVFYPATPLLIGAGNAAAEAWPRALAQAIDRVADADIAIGVLDDNDQVIAVADATINRIYAASGSGVVGAFLQGIPVAGPGQSCTVAVRGGANPWWAGLDVGTDSETVVLDFTGTGLDLGDNVNVDAGVFSARISGQVLTLTKPFWVSRSNPGYMGFNASNNPALAAFSPPRCQ